VRAFSENLVRGNLMRQIFAALTLWCVCGGASFAQTTAAPTTQETVKPAPATAAGQKNDYGDGDNWLCRPRRRDACAVDQSSTVISASGKLTVEPWAADPNAPIDCFYVYPTVSNAPAGNSDMTPGPEEKGVVRVQFARFASQCRPYAPLYRQATITALKAAVVGLPIPVNRAMAYGDVLDAWNYYLEHDNHGRGVVLIGHSQGALVLTKLIRDEIDGKSVQARLISALLLGINLPVPTGKDVGGAFQHIPLCHAADQTGCVITYVSFRASYPPPAGSRFGKVDHPSMMAACTNPAALGGGSGELHAYLTAHGSGIVVDSNTPQPWVKPEQPITTPFVSVPGMLTAECVANEHGSYLAVTVHGDAGGPRASDIAGDVVMNGQVGQEWGLHLIDVNEAMGNLIEIVSQQSKTYRSAAEKK
jgi:Protein of unknown function (DUF3089)